MRFQSEQAAGLLMSLRFCDARVANNDPMLRRWAIQKEYQWLDGQQMNGSEATLIQNDPIWDPILRILGSVWNAS